jgi:DNA-directed RNA polymerase subunit RPC12/RpoP
MRPEVMGLSGQGRLVGWLLVATGVVVVAGVLAWGAAGVAEGRLQATGFALLAVGVLAVIAAPLIGGGVVLIRQGAQEAVEVEALRQQQRLVGMVEAQGTVSIARAAVELGVSRDRLQELIYDLVGKGLFTGYVDWKGGQLVAQDAAQIQQAAADGRCPNCGGQVELAGKGVVRCPYCGAEIFLSASLAVGRG